jgi:hypothetical protein
MPEPFGGQLWADCAFACLITFQPGYSENIQFLDIEFQHPKCAEWDVGALIRGRNSFTELSLLSKPSTQILRFRTATQFQGVTTLRLTRMKEVDALSIISVLPQLSCLEFNDVTFTEPAATTRKTCSSLLYTLLIRCCQHQSWLSSLSCPNLVTFIHAGNAFPTSFLYSHRSIVALEYSNTRTPGILHEIGGTFPDIKWLSIDELEFRQNRHLSSAQTLSFPYLEHLKVYQITLEMFEDIVRTRCLPISNSKSRLLAYLKPLKTLSILQPQGRISDEVASSELFKSATKHIAVDPYWDGLDKLTLSWL